MSYPLWSDDPHPDEEILSEGENDFEDEYDEDEYPDGPDYIVVR